MFPVYSKLLQNSFKIFKARKLFLNDMVKEATNNSVLFQTLLFAPYKITQANKNIQNFLDV